MSSRSSRYFRLIGLFTGKKTTNRRKQMGQASVVSQLKSADFPVLNNFRSLSVSLSWSPRGFTVIKRSLRKRSNKCAWSLGQLAIRNGFRKVEKPLSEYTCAEDSPYPANSGCTTNFGI